MANPPNLAAFWPRFNDHSAYVEVICDFKGSLAQKVMEHFLPGMCNDSIGGALEDIDIKQMDAFTVVKLSLLQASADDNKYYEAIFNHSKGEVEFKAIGDYNGNVTDVYYTTATFNYIEECNGVMITGKKPLTERKILNWKPIWGNLTEDERIFDTSDMATGCNADNFSQYATIVYNDPQLTNGTQGYEDGLENLFEQGSTPGMDLGPYDSVIGYVKWKYLPEDLVNKDTDVKYNSNAYIPIKIGTEKATPNGPYIGKKLAKHPTFSQDFDNPACWDALSTLGSDSINNWDDGLIINIPSQFRFTSPRGVEVDKFLGISKVYVIGREMEYKVMSTDPASSIKKDEELTAADVQLIVTVNRPINDIIELERGVHWQVAYKDVNKWKEPRIVFADNSGYNNPYEFGNNCEFKVARFSSYYNKNNEKIDIATRTVLPLTATKGVIVEEIWAVVNLETPSIIIYDPRGGSGGPYDDEPFRALKIAIRFDYQLAPMIVTEYPAPIGYNGRLLDQTVGLKDNDPTTAQNFEETELNKAMDEMNGGSGLTLNLSFLDDEQVAKLSGVLYTYMNGRDGQEKVYTCGPHAQPELGGVGPDGGIINQINYSYTDSQSYTISVNEGPKLVGQLAQIGTGPYFKAAEDVSRGGIIIEDPGNHINYTVRLDQYGDRPAINCCDQILRTGDRVSCTIHNNAVEA